MIVALATAAEDVVHDEVREQYTARWMGIAAGLAEVRVRVEAGVRTVNVHARSADWLAGLYPIEDRMLSVSNVSGGSAMYQTWFREGRFQQDQSFTFGPSLVQIERNQRFDDGWKASSDVKTVPSPIEDPISAFWQVREARLAPGESMIIAVFNGKRTLNVLATAQPTGIITIRSAREGDYQGGIDLKLTHGDLEWAEVQTRAGPVRVTRD